MSNRNRSTFRWKVRLWLGSHAQRIVWWLCDPHDRWMIEYRDAQGRMFGHVSTGFYSLARVVAKELGGEIVGSGVITIECEIADDDGEGWKQA